MFALCWQPFSQHKHWHADSLLLVARFILFTRHCQTNLSRVPSLGQLWECIKSVKMAALTGSWHSLHLGMVSKYDIPPFCPKVIIFLLKPATGPLQLLYGYHAPPTGLLCNLHQTLVFAATFFSLLSLSWIHRLSLLCSSWQDQTLSASTLLLSFIYFSLFILPTPLL